MQGERDGVHRKDVQCLERGRGRVKEGGREHLSLERDGRRGRMCGIPPLSRISLCSIAGGNTWKAPKVNNGRVTGG